MKHFFTVIISNEPIAKDFYQIIFDWDQEISIPEPGQFLTIRISDGTVPLLRRPFALSGYEKKNQKASIIYQKRGAATEILAGKKAGDKLDIIGPMGNSFKIEDSIDTCVIVAGGIGLGPMLYTASYLKTIGRKVLFIFGAKNKSFIPQKDIFSSLSPVICTDDGSEGFIGTTVDYLLSIKNEDIKSAMVFACGPMPMLKGCHEFAMKNNLHCHVSMEQIMACGVGACMGCAIKVEYEPGFARVCSEGPVFNSQDIAWT